MHSSGNFNDSISYVLDSFGRSRFNPSWNLPVLSIRVLLWYNVKSETGLNMICFQSQKSANFIPLSMKKSIARKILDMETDHLFYRNENAIVAEISEHEFELS